MSESSGIPLMRFTGVLLIALVFFESGCAASRTTSYERNVVSWPSIQKRFVISGSNAEAIAIALADWRKNVSRGKYRLSDQEISVRPASGGNVAVEFLPRPDAGPPSVGGETKYGVETHYIIDPERARIVTRLFAE